MIKRVVVWGVLTVSTIGAGMAAGAQPATGTEPQESHQHEAAARSVGSEQYDPELRAELELLRAATERFRDHRVAAEEGYELVAGDGPLMGEHWVRRDLVDRPFDIDAPSTLQYLQIDGERVLTGVAYTVYRAPDDPLPVGFAGDHDAWHVHDMIKISMTPTEGRPLLRWLTERRIANGRTQWSTDRPELTMVHAWVWMDNPDGVFAQDHRLIPYARVGLPREWGVHAGLDAAYGVALLAEDACRFEVRKTNWLAVATWRQRRDLRDACTSAEGDVRSALAELDDLLPSTDATAFNAAAAAAWQGYVARRDEILTAEQVARLAVGIEHPEGHSGGR